MVPLLLSCNSNKQQASCGNGATDATTATRNSSSNKNGLGEQSGSMDFLDCPKLMSCVEQLTPVNLICFSIVFCLLIQSGEAQSMGMPCICNSTFYQTCPPAGECLENHPIDDGKKPPKFLPGNNDYDDDYQYDYPSDDRFHDDYDPDHVDLDSLYYPRPVASRPAGLDPFYQPPLNPPLSTLIQPDPFVMHRKVYVAPKPIEDVPILPIKITVPLKFPESSRPDIPPPRPMFKLKKYTTYETKPEIHMMPITKTIIRPVGVSPDQIIDETGTVKKLL